MVSTRVSDYSGYTTGYTYDEAGLLTGMTYPDGLIVNWQRDAAGNITAVQATRGGVLSGRDKLSQKWSFKSEPAVIIT